MAKRAKLFHYAKYVPKIQANFTLTILRLNILWNILSINTFSVIPLLYLIQEIKIQKIFIRLDQDTTIS